MCVPAVHRGRKLGSLQEQKGLLTAKTLVQPCLSIKYGLFVIGIINVNKDIIYTLLFF